MGNQIGVGLMPPCAARIQNFNDWRDFFSTVKLEFYFIWDKNFLVFFLSYLLIATGNTSAFTKTTKAGLINI